MKDFKDIKGEIMEKNHMNLQLFAENGDSQGADKETGAVDIELQSKIDKAVTKALQTQKANLEKEYNTTLKGLQDKLNSFEEKGLSDAEKVAKQLEAAKIAEQNFIEKQKRLELGVSFTKMGVNEDDYSPIIDAYFKGDFISANSKISEIIEKRANDLAASKYNAMLEKVPNPNQGNGDKEEMTQAKFDKLSYSQQVKAIAEHPEYQKFIK